MFTPFDPVSKRITAEVEKDGKRYTCAKGAPNSILKLKRFKEEDQVVSLLQERGHLTAMTGDGVNDAPSLKKADCGIAVERASDTARTAADVVFLDEGLRTIITAIKVARQIFHRMKAYIIYR